MKSLSAVLLFTLLVIVFAAFMPIALIWSINTLFELKIPYTVETWAAALVISSVFGTTGLKRKG